MLPLILNRDSATGDLSQARDHPLYRVLRRRPNAWQTPFEFKGLMQFRALTEDKGAVALVVRSPRGPVTDLIPLDPKRVDVRQGDDFAMRYTYQRKSGGRVDLKAKEVLHLRGLTFDGVNGLSRVRKSADAIAIAIAAERATAALFRNGTFASGTLEVTGELSDAAYARLKESWASRHTGADNAGSTPILEGGASYKAFAMSARDAQSAESRRFQVEEILRTFGVPRPLAMMDDTGWGTGIEQLSIGFVRYAMNPWFRAWSEAIGRDLLDEREVDLEAIFNAEALLNGTIKDQFEAYAKAAGAGGHRPWMTGNDIRRRLGMSPHPDGDSLEPAGGAKPDGKGDDPTEELDAAADAALRKRQPSRETDDED
jgi:HK97 family phage portal protein